MFSAYQDPGRTAEQIAQHGVTAAAEFDDATSLPLTSFTVALLNR